MIDRRTALQMIGERLSRRRYEHSLRVAATAAEYARRWGAAPAAAELAGLLHDYCRELSKPEILTAAARHGIPVSPIEARRPVGLLHAPVAAAELAELGVDSEITTAISRHTLGCPGMSRLDECLYLADLCEPGRDLEGLDALRVLALASLDEAVAAATRFILLDLLTRGKPVMPIAIDLYNERHV